MGLHEKAGRDMRTERKNGGVGLVGDSVCRGREKRGKNGGEGGRVAEERRELGRQRMGEGWELVRE